MKSVPLLATTLLLLAALPVPAQDTAAPAELLTDDSGDVTMATSGQSQATPQTAVSGSIDLVALHAVEGERDFTFTVAVDDLESTADTPWLWGANSVHFHHEEMQYRLIFSNYLNFGDTDDDGHYADLDEYDSGTDSYSTIAELDSVVDVAAGTFTATVPRDLLLDQNGAKPFPGRALTEFYVESRGITICGSCNIMDVQIQGPTQTDRMPQSGFGDIPLPVLFGLEQSGHARLHSDEPFRYSNGEASTFVYEVEARNTGKTDDTFKVEPTGLPAGWDVRTPASVVQVPGGGNVTVPIVLRTPFAHDHGESQSFVLELQSQSDPASVGRVELGIHYPEIPQPAGHHDTLTIHTLDHSDDPFLLAIGATLGTAVGQDVIHEPYLNTLAEDPAADGVEVGNMWCQDDWDSYFPEGSVYCWSMELRPGLKMGLDLDMEQAGTVSASFKTLLPIDGAELRGKVFYLEPSEDPGAWWDREEILVAEITPVAAKDIAAGGSETLDAVVTPTEDGDLVPYQKDGALQIRLALTSTTVDTLLTGKDQVKLQPGGQIQLPLLEYEDPIDEVFGQAGALRLVADVQQKMVNPGESVVYEAVLRNEGTLEDAFRIGVVGENDAWATLLTKKAVTLAAGKETTIKVAVAPPAGTKDDARADLILEAQSASDPNTRALLRLVTTVDTDVDHKDEGAVSDLLAQERDAPGPAAALGLLAVLAAFVAVRRRHG